MKPGKGIGLLNLLFACMIIGVLIALFIPAIKASRSQARQVKCLSNLKQLQLGWLMYADDFDGAIVNGHAWYWKRWDNSESNATSPKGWLLGQPISSTGDLESSLRSVGRDSMIDNLKHGTLYPYIRSEKVYPCSPFAFKTQDIPIPSYSIVESMAGPTERIWGCSVPDSTTSRPTTPYVTHTQDLHDPPPQSRLVFICTETAQPSFRVSYYLNSWIGSPPMHHGRGTCMSFADGHCEHWRWQEPETLALGELMSTGTTTIHFSPQAGHTNSDVMRLQQGVWGKRAYSDPPGAP